jgi:hypothetical protein
MNNFYQPPGALPPYGYGQPVPVDHPRATSVLVLGILSLVLCPLFGPFASVMGRRALKEIDSSGGTIGGRSVVKAGYVCGMIPTVIILVYAVIGAVIGVVALVGYLVPGH